MHAMVIIVLLTANLCNLLVTFYSRGRKLGKILVVVAPMLMMVDGVNSIRKGRFMASEPKISEASTLFSAGRYAEARDAFIAAGHAGADKLFIAGAVVECDFAMGDDDRLFKDCDVLHQIPGGEGKARFFRGQSMRRAKKFTEARHELEIAARLGHPVAHSALLALDKEAGQ